MLLSMTPFISKIRESFVKASAAKISAIVVSNSMSSCYFWADIATTVFSKAIRSYIASIKENNSILTWLAIIS